MSEQYIKRPLNSFMLFAKKYRPIILKETANLPNSYISELLGKLWKMITPEQRDMYINQAKLEKDEHCNKHPDYKYKPRIKKPKAVKIVSKERKIKVSKIEPKFNKITMEDMLALTDGYNKNGYNKKHNEELYQPIISYKMTHTTDESKYIADIELKNVMDAEADYFQYIQSN